MAAPATAAKVSKNVVAIFLGQVQVEKDQSGARRVRIRVGGIEELRCGVAVGDEV